MNFKTYGRYTIVYCELGRTRLMEIVIGRRNDRQRYYRIVRRTNNAGWASVSKKHQFAVPDQEQLKDWLVFEGHNLPIAIDQADPDFHYPDCISFIAANSTALKDFIVQNCLNLSTMHLAKIHFSLTGETRPGRLELFPPQRVLCNIKLYDEVEVYAGIFFALASDGHGVLHNGRHYLASAYQYVLGASNYRVHIHQAPFCPDKSFSRAGYKSQASAIKGLLFHADRLYRTRNISSLRK
jgi:hypothetical protein